MATYLIGQWKVDDPHTFERYRDELRSLVDRFGGRLRAHGAVEVLEGDPPHPTTLLVVEMPSADAARLLHGSPEYEPLGALLAQSARGSLWVVESE